MRVAFDGICLADRPITGVGRAFLNGLEAYAARAPATAVLLLPAGALDPAIPEVEVVGCRRGALWRQLMLPRLLRRLRIDVLHSSVASVPLHAPCPTIATVHDLPWLHPESGERTSWRRRFVTRRSLRAAAAVIAPSRFTMAAAKTLLGGDERRLFHIPHSTRLWPQMVEGAEADERRGPLLVLGDDRPRKNRERVRAAHALARRRCADLPELRFVGPPDDYVDEAEKARLLRSCRALVQCSLFEGFGMPVLEGMAHGAPVLCADIPPFRELAPGVATSDDPAIPRLLFADPRDVHAIAAGMLRIHSERELRSVMVQTAWCQASIFQPPIIADRWFELHQELLR